MAQAIGERKEKKKERLELTLQFFGQQIVPNKSVSAMALIITRKTGEQTLSRSNFGRLTDYADSGWGPGVLSPSRLACYLCFRAHLSVGCGRWGPEASADSDLIILVICPLMTALTCSFSNMLHTSVVSFSYLMSSRP